MRQSMAVELLTRRLVLHRWYPVNPGFDDVRTGGSGIQVAAEPPFIGNGGNVVIGGGVGGGRAIGTL